MFELVYTSTSQGLIAGRSGFTTVALTEGFPPNLIATIENMSGYKPIFLAGEKNEDRNPVNFSCRRLNFGKTAYIVLSRISYFGLSYTGRSNVLAHHLLFLPDELDGIPGGAVSVLRAEENFPPWDGRLRTLPRNRKAKYLPLPRGGAAWDRLAGDPRWAEYTADRFRSDPEKGFALAFDPLLTGGAEILSLIAETAAKLTRDEVRDLTFSTYSYSAGTTDPLFFRSLVKDSAQLGSIRRLDPGSIIRLGEKNALPAAWLEKAERPAPAAPSPEKTGRVDPVPPVSAPAPAGGAAASPAEHVRHHATASRADARPAAAASVAPSGRTAGDTGSPETAGKGKRFCLALVTAAAAILLALVFWRIFSAREPQPDTKATRTPPETAVKPSGAGQEKPETPAAKAERRSVRPAPSAPAPPRPPETRRPGAPFGRPNDRELFELYRVFHTGGSRALPDALKAAAALELEIRSVGGVTEIADGDLPKFVVGNGTAAVTVRPCRRQDSGLAVEWVPDRAPGGMTFRLADGGIIEVELPRPETGARRPAPSDIVRVTFVSGRGERRGFDVNDLPRVFDAILDDEAKKTANYDAVAEGSHIKVVFTVPDGLWAFRGFYTIRVGGRESGASINERGEKIVLRDLDLNRILSELRKRNAALARLREREARSAAFETENRKYLAPPELESAARLRKLLGKFPPFEGKSVSGVLFEASGNEGSWHELTSAIRRALWRQVKAERMGKKEFDALAAELKEFRDNCRMHRKKLKELAEHKDNLEKARREYAATNKRFGEILESFSPALYRAAESALNDRRELNGEFYRKVGLEELLKDMKIEIIRREHQ